MASYLYKVTAHLTSRLNLMSSSRLLTASGLSPTALQRTFQTSVCRSNEESELLHEDLSNTRQQELSPSNEADIIRRSYLNRTNIMGDLAEKPFPITSDDGKLNGYALKITVYDTMFGKKVNHTELLVYCKVPACFPLIENVLDKGKRVYVTGRLYTRHRHEPSIFIKALQIEALL